jgi:hypothetical protein
VIDRPRRVATHDARDPGPQPLERSAYALSAAVVRTLIERGCEHLLVADALTMPPGLQYFQARLDFGPRNVVLRST